jgi:hypothetical protein
MRSLQFTIYNKKEVPTKITNTNGYADQHLQYLPFGELFISQRNTNFDSRYKFTENKSCHTKPFRCSSVAMSLGFIITSKISV